MQITTESTVSINSGLSISVSSFELEHSRIYSEIPLVSGEVFMQSGGFKSVNLTLFGNVYSPKNLIVTLDGLIRLGTVSGFSFEGMTFSSMILKQYKCRRNDKGIYSCELVFAGSCEVSLNG